MNSFHEMLHELDTGNESVVGVQIVEASSLVVVRTCGGSTGAVGDSSIHLESGYSTDETGSGSSTVSLILFRHAGHIVTDVAKNEF